MPGSWRERGCGGRRWPVSPACRLVTSQSQLQRGRAARGNLSHQYWRPDGRATASSFRFILNLCMYLLNLISKFHFDIVKVFACLPHAGRQGAYTLHFEEMVGLKSYTPMIVKRPLRDQYFNI